LYKSKGLIFNDMDLISAPGLGRYVVRDIEPVVDRSALSDPGARILVIRLGAVGDCLRVCPAIKRLREARPAATVAWAVEDRVLSVLEGHPAIDRFHVLRRSELNAGVGRAWAEIKRFRRELRAGRYEVVIDFHGRLKSGLVAWMSGVPLRVGYSRKDGSECNYLFMNQRVSLRDSWENRVLRFLELLSPLGINTAVERELLGLHLDPAALLRASEMYSQAGCPELALYPGCSSGRAGERWPLERWRQYLQRLDAAGIRSMLLWGPDEVELVEQLRGALGSSSCVAPSTTLPELVALTGQFRAYVGSDTAALHMAWLQGVPAAVFTGPKPSVTASPLALVEHRILRSEEHYVEGLAPSRQSPGVTTEVTVEQVVTATRSLLAASSASA